MKVEFSSGYTTEISNTKDYAIKEFPAQVLPQIRESLNAFLKGQTFLQSQNSKVEIDAVLLWGCDAKGNIIFWLPACIDHDVTDHAGRKTFRLTGSIVVKRNTPVATWNIVVLSSARKEQIQQWITNSNFLQIDPQVRRWPEFAIIDSRQNHQIKISRAKYTKYITMLFMLCVSLAFTVFYLDRELAQKTIVFHKLDNNFQQLQSQKQQLGSTQEMLRKAIRDLLSEKIEASQGIRAWVHGRYPTIEKVFDKLADDDTFDDGLSMFLEIANDDKNLCALLNNYEPGFVYDAQNNSAKRNVKQQIIAEGKVNQYKAIAYYLGALQLYKNFTHNKPNIKDKR